MSENRNHNKIPHSTRPRRVGRKNEGRNCFISYCACGSSVRTSDGNTGEPEPLLDVQDVLDAIGRRQDGGLGDETVLVALDGADHGSLGSRGLIMVNDTDSTK